MGAVVVQVDAVLQQLAELGVGVVAPPGAVVPLVAVVGAVDHLLPADKVQKHAVTTTRNVALGKDVTFLKDLCGSVNVGRDLITWYSTQSESPEMQSMQPSELSSVQLTKPRQP